ncbi:MAG TPA: hypothetical protein VNX18_19195 [Bryobacteraceae bacterium]|nr:hypothetical protein [Bryobacteraceae bacterium]
MLPRLAVLASGFWLFAALTCGAPRGCVGSTAVTSFRLSARPSGTNAPQAIPIHQVNNLGSGFRISYAPLDLPANLGKDAKLTLVVLPKANDGQLTVLEPRLAASSTEWATPFAARIVLVVFAPQGLDEKRLTNLVTRDDNMVAALADYADQTADLEAGLQLARELEEQADDESTRSVRPTTPAEQAIFALVRALNPSVSSYDPLGAGRRAGSATMMGKGVEGFFENAGGLFPGAGALPMIKQFLMPDTEFRSVYAIPGDSDGMTLCAQLAPRTRNKLAYMWAYRVINTAPPAASVLKDSDVPIGLRVGVPLKLDNQAQWRLMDHVFDWTLVPQGFSQPPMHVMVRPIPDERALRVDLRKFAGAPGAYTLQGKWDWDTYQIAGTVRLHRFDDLKSARLTPESQDRLIAGSGPVDVEVSGCDFLFVDHATVHRPQSARQIPVDLPPDRPAAQQNLRVELDTDALRAGPYLLALSRIDGAVTDVPFRVLPPVPKLDRIRVNAGEREQAVTLTGTGLDRIVALESDRAEIVLSAATEGGSQRNVTVRLRAGAKAGDSGTLSAKVDGMAGALRLPVALQVVAARPRILEAKPSLPRDLVIAPRDGEIPAGSWVGFAMKTDLTDAQPVLTVQCAEPALTAQLLKLRGGEKQPGGQLISGGAGALFLSLDPGAVGQSGCTLTAIVETEVGKSDAFTLGKVVRVPRIESFTMTDEKSGDGFYGILKGFDLETIEKTGWDARVGLNVAEMPRPIAGEGSKQSLRIAMPWPSPSPKAPLSIWLRGEAEGRATKVTP